MSVVSVKISKMPHIVVQWLIFYADWSYDDFINANILLRSARNYHETEAANVTDR